MYSSTNPSNGEPFIPLTVVEYRAANDPQATWAKIPISDDTYEHGFVDINYAQFQNAVDGTAEWLKTATGKEPGTPIAFFGPWDPRYVWMVLGACKAGYKIVLPSLLFSAQTMNRIVLEQLNCRTVIVAQHSMPPTVAEFVSINDLECHQCPPVSYFLHEPHEHIPYNKSYEQCADDILAIMYTSGSTHDAKPIFWTNSFAASFLRQNVMEPPAGWESLDSTQQGTRLLNILPPLLCGSLYNHLFTAPLTKSIMHYPLPNSKAHPETFLELIQYHEVDTAVMSPSFAEYIAADPARVALVAQKVKYLGYGGGPLSEFAGQTLSRYIGVFSLFACTENGVYPLIRPAGQWDPERWQTVTFHPKGGIALERLNDGSHEVVISRPLGSSSHDPLLAPALKAFPHLAEWRSEDVFCPDPSEPGSWTYSSRITDVIRYTDGRVFNPLLYEQHVRSHPAVAAALLYLGTRNNVVMLLEPAPEFNTPELNKVDFIEKVWPCIEEANRLACGNCTVSRSSIIVTQPGKEIPRAYKGTTQRGKARGLYEREIMAVPQP